MCSKLIPSSTNLIKVRKRERQRKEERKRGREGKEMRKE
jgi:hypothetical protein